jgi:hypothetical protein
MASQPKNSDRKAPLSGKHRGKNNRNGNGWKPSPEAKKLLANFAGNLIVLPKGEQNWIINRLIENFSTRRSKTNRVKNKKGSKDKSKAKPKKKSWKTEWHASPEYQKWQSLVTPKGAPRTSQSAELFEKARQSAFRVRDEIRTEHQNEEEMCAAFPKVCQDSPTDKSKEEKPKEVTFGSTKERADDVSNTTSGSARRDQRAVSARRKANASRVKRKETAKVSYSSTRGQ